MSKPRNECEQKEDKCDGGQDSRSYANDDSNAHSDNFNQQQVGLINVATGDILSENSILSQNDLFTINNNDVWF